MSENLNLVKGYLLDIDLKIVSEDEAEELIVVEDEENGIHNLIIDCEPPIVILEQLIMGVPEDAGDFFKRLLQMNRTMVHGAFVLDDEEGNRVLFRDTLQLENLDCNELEGSIRSLELALAEFFAKGIVGVVARTNRKYLVDYPSRENIFMQLLRSLRKPFHLGVERDRAVRTLEAARWNYAPVHAGEETATGEVGVLRRRWKWSSFCLRVVRLPNAGVDFGVPETAALSVHLGASFGDLKISLRDTVERAVPRTPRTWRGSSSPQRRRAPLLGNGNPSTEVEAAA